MEEQKPKRIRNSHNLSVRNFSQASIINVQIRWSNQINSDSSRVVQHHSGQWNRTVNRIMWFVNRITHTHPRCRCCCISKIIHNFFFFSRFCLLASQSARATAQPYCCGLIIVIVECMLYVCIDIDRSIWFINVCCFVWARAHTIQYIQFNRIRLKVKVLLLALRPNILLPNNQPKCISAQHTEQIHCTPSI